MTITYKEYHQEVQNIANTLITENMGDYESKEELEEALNDCLLHETIDGHMWVIYYSYNLDVYQHSDNRDYYEDNFGGDDLASVLKEKGLNGLHTVLAFWCLYADVAMALYYLMEELEWPSTEG